MTLTVMIMAAGQSQRFGGCKLLAPLKDKPLLDHTLQLASALQPDHLRVVTGAWHDALVAAQQTGTLSAATLVFNPNWATGLGGSIAFGVEQLPPDTETLLILLADQVALTLGELKEMVMYSEHHDIVCSVYSGKRGVPAVFNRRVFSMLKTLSGDQGAKSLLYSDTFRVRGYPLPSAQYDIDTPEALRLFCAGS